MKALHISLISACLATSAFAGVESSQSYSGKQQQYSAPPSTSLYNAGEWNIDLFGAYADSDSDNDYLFDEGTFGGGLGISYFFTRNLGIGAEGTLFDTDGDALGSTSLNLVLRFPIAETGLAPYIFGGAGINFNADDLDSDDFEEARDRIEDDDEPNRGDDVLFLAHAGAGLEFRFTPGFSIFSDARYNWSEEDNADYAQVRAGVRFVF